MSIRYKEGERKEGRKAERVVQTQNQHTCSSCCGPCIDDLPLEMYYKLLVPLGTCRFLLQAGWRRS
jgi:hypothetical protein